MVTLAERLVRHCPQHLTHRNYSVSTMTLMLRSRTSVPAAAEGTLRHASQVRRGEAEIWHQNDRRSRRSSPQTACVRVFVRACARARTEGCGSRVRRAAETSLPQPTLPEASVCPPSQDPERRRRKARRERHAGRAAPSLASGFNSVLLENESESRVRSSTSATWLSEAWSWATPPLRGCCRPPPCCRGAGPLEAVAAVPRLDTGRRKWLSSAFLCLLAAVTPRD